MVFDLRLVIGLFFAVLGVILLIASQFVTGVLGSGVASSTIDFVAGLIMLTFSFTMLALAHKWRKKP